MAMKLTNSLIPQMPVDYTGPTSMDTMINIYKDVKHEAGHLSYMVYDMSVYLEKYGMDLQRGLVWSLEQKQKFILTIMRRLKVAPLWTVVNYDKDLCRVVDGKQRLSTVLSYMDNEFPVGLADGNEYFYKDLPYDIAYAVNIYSFDAYIHHEHERVPESLVSDDQLIDLFLFINDSGTPQQGEYIDKLKTLK